MANADSAFGLRPARSANGGAWNGAVQRCTIPAANGTAVFVGDAVKLTTTGTEFTGYDQPNQGGVFPGVIQAAAGDDIYGVVTAIEPDRSDLENQHRLASTERQVSVALATKDTIWEIQADDDATTLDEAALGLTADLVVAAGSTSTGLSGMELDSSSANAGTTNDQVRIVGFRNAPDNKVGETNGVWEVMINESELFTAGGI